jgi:hypothetical protein
MLPICTKVVPFSRRLFRRDLDIGLLSRTNVRDLRFLAGLEMTQGI